MQNPNDHAPPPSQSQASSSGGGSAKRPAGRLRTGAILALALTIAAVFAIGLFAGRQFGGGVAALPTVNNPGTGIPALTEGNIEAVREAVVTKVRPTVVQINVVTQNGGELGSGVIIDPRGYIVTNNHVIAGGQKIQVVLFDGHTLPGQIAGTAPNDDLAVVKIDPGKIKLAVATIGDSSKLRVGQEVLAVGNPLGITQTVTNGIVSALDRNVADGPNGAILPGTIQTDAPINPGNSGGALVDLRGSLIGVPTLAALDPQFRTPANGVGFAIPSNRVKFIAPQLIESGKVTHTGRAALGVQVTSVDPVIAAQNNLPVDHGALITNVTPGGPAAQAGLRAGDIIVQIDGKPVANVSSLSSALVSKNPGDKVAVGIYRGNQQETVNVTLGELPAR
ncbi:MAG TPA: trypsin-like peptidase domain-containing protein [Ktedonobacteraceae bacterium]|nr:trypsin-like peptidase domain-containing protein [Ktedonobacteraceae bacterium]